MNMEPSPARSQVAEISLCGDLALDRTYVSPGPSLPVVQLRDVLAQLEQAQETGVRAVLLTVDSLGGDAWAGFGLYHALREFSEAGGHVVAYVKGIAGSTAALYVLAADHVVVDPGAVVHPHGAGSLQEDSELVQAALEVDALLAGAVYAADTFGGQEDVLRWVDQPGEEMHAPRAVAAGFADVVGDLQAARGLADELAIGIEVHSPRRATLASLGRSPELEKTVESVREIGAEAADCALGGRPLGPFFAQALGHLHPKLAGLGTLPPRAVRHLRMGSTIVLLFGKIPTGLKQGLGLFTSAKDIKQRHMVSGLRQFLRGGWKEYLAESGEGRHMDMQLDRDARELFASLQSRMSDLGRAKAQVIEWGAAPIMLVQKAVNAITWYAAREQALEEGHADPKAYADSLVRMTQTAGGIKDLAAIQRGGETFKMLTVFFSYRQILYNLLAEKTGKTGWAKTREVFARTWFLLLLPVVVEHLLMAGVKDKEDPEDVAKRLALELALLPLSTIPILGDVAEAGFAGREMKAAPWIATLGKGIASGKDVLEGEGDIRDARQLAELVGVTLHLPTDALWRYGEWAVRLADEDLKEPGRDLLFRSPSQWE